MGNSPVSTSGILAKVLDNDAAALRTKMTGVTIDNVSLAVEMDSADGAALVTGGVASSAAQSTGNASLSSMDTKLSSQATAAKQDTGNASLSAIDTNTARNNREKVLRATDMVVAVTWADHGTVDARVTTKVYSSASLGLSVTETRAYTNTGGAYRLDSKTWST